MFQSKVVAALLNVFLPLVFLSGCINRNDYRSSQRYLTDSNNPALAWILNGDYQAVKSFYDLPKDVRTTILPEPPKYVCGYMAEPNQQFNDSDVIVETLPLYRFVTGGFSKDYAFVCYQKGGFLPSELLVVMKRDEGKTRIIFYGSSRGASLGELKAFLKNEEIDEIPDLNDLKVPLESH